MSVNTVKHWAQFLGAPEWHRRSCLCSWMNNVRSDSGSVRRPGAQTRVSVPRPRRSVCGTVCAKFLKSHGAYSNCCSFSCGEIFHCVRDRRAEARGQGDCFARKFLQRAYYYGAEGVEGCGEACTERSCGEEVGDPFDE